MALDRHLGTRCKVGQMRPELQERLSDSNRQFDFFVSAGRRISQVLPLPAMALGLAKWLPLRVLSRQELITQPAQSLVGGEPQQLLGGLVPEHDALAGVNGPDAAACVGKPLQAENCLAFHGRRGCFQSHARSARRLYAPCVCTAGQDRLMSWSGACVLSATRLGRVERTTLSRASLVSARPGN